MDELEKVAKLKSPLHGGVDQSMLHMNPSAPIRLRRIETFSPSLGEKSFIAF